MKPILPRVKMGNETGFLIPDSILEEAIRIRDAEGIEAALKYVNEIIFGEETHDEEEKTPQ